MGRLGGSFSHILFWFLGRAWLGMLLIAFSLLAVGAVYLLARYLR